MNQPLLCYIPAIPYSCDPEHYDFAAHHMVCRSLFSTLVTQYEKGALKGVVAKSWSNSNDYKEWQFELREDARFQNGEAITPKHVINSWKRLAIIQKKTKNKLASLLENIEGMDHLDSIDDTVSGLISNNSSLIIKLKNADKELLKTVSFGLYSIVHPNQYDSQGQWIQKDLISSGPYFLSKWDDKAVTIAHRNNWIPDIGHQRKFQTIKFFWNEEDKDKADLVISTSIDSSIPKLKFYGPVPSGIYYTRLFNWKSENSFFNQENHRIAFANALKQEFAASGMHYPETFFPVLSKPEIDQERKVAKPNRPYKIRLALWGGKVSPIAHRYALIIESAAKNIGVEVERVTAISAEDFMRDLRSNDGLNSEYDFALMGTGVLIEAPVEDIRFMFLTKDGVNMPDSTGEINKELRKESPSIAHIEELMAKQKLVFPLGHIANGLWANEKVDLSRYNTILPPADFEWIGQK